MKSNVHEEASSRGAGVGVLGVLCGVVILVGCLIEANTGLRGLPRFWHANQPLWFLFGLSALGGGVWLLAPRSSATHFTHWRPTLAGIRFRQLVVYSRDPCPLCDEALDVLSAYRRWLPTITVVDIDTDPRLVEQYGLSVPVVACDDKIRFRGHVKPELLQRLIEGTPPL